MSLFPRVKNVQEIFIKDRKLIMNIRNKTDLILSF